jgi:hypothetical protein
VNLIICWPLAAAAAQFVLPFPVLLATASIARSVAVGEGEKKLYGTGGEFSFQMVPTFCSIDVLSDALSDALSPAQNKLRRSDSR